MVNIIDLHSLFIKILLCKICSKRLSMNILHFECNFNLSYASER